MPGAFEPKIFFGLALGAKRRARRPPVFKIDDHAPETGKIFFGLALGAARRARRAPAVYWRRIARRDVAPVGTRVVGDGRLGSGTAVLGSNRLSEYWRLTKRPNFDFVHVWTADAPP